MATFEAAIDVVLKHEGGYVCHPDDPGGETKFGISKRRYPELDIPALTRAEAVAIYRRDFWNPSYEKIPVQKIADKLFDASLNMDHGDTRPYYETSMQAVSLLQRALNDEGGRVDVDGRFGPQTLMAVKLMPTVILLRAFRARLAWHYAELRAQDASRKTFCLGWMRRAVLAIALVAAPAFHGPALAQQDTLERMEDDFFKLNDACDALPAEELRVGGETFLRRPYRCGHRLWRLWQARCPEGYWSRVFLLDQADGNEDSYYLDRFAGLHNGRPALLVEVYRPSCSRT